MADITTNIFNLNNRNTPILQKSYNDFQNELLRLDTHNSLVGSVNQLREDRINKNRNNINNLDADLMTTRRQVEIIQNRNLIKEDIIYILRALFVFIGVTVISYVYLEGTPYRQPALFAIAILAIYYFGGKGLSFLSRSANRWSMTNWQGVKYANLVKAPEEDVCAAENAAYDAQMAKIKGKILDKLIAMKSRFNKLERNKKLLTERGEKMKNDYHDIIAKADIIFDKLPKDKQDIILEAKKKEIAKEPRTMKVQPISQNQNKAQSPDKLESNVNANSDKKAKKPSRDSLKMGLAIFFEMAGQPINLLNNEQDIDAVITEYQKLEATGIPDKDASYKVISEALKKKGVQEVDIKKAFDEVEKKLKNMGK